MKGTSPLPRGASLPGGVVPLVMKSHSCPVVVRDHPSGTGRDEASGMAGSAYFAFQLLEGSWSLALNFDVRSVTHRRRRTARMRSSSSVAGSGFGCHLRHSAVSVPSTAAFKTEAR